MRRSVRISVATVLRGVIAKSPLDVVYILLGVSRVALLAWNVPELVPAVKRCAQSRLQLLALITLSHATA